MNLFGISSRAWRLWGLFNAGVAGAFYIVYEILTIISPSQDLLMLQNLIMAGVFGAIASICVFIAETPRKSAQGRSQTHQHELNNRGGQNAGSPTQKEEDPETENEN